MENRKTRMESAAQSQDIIDILALKIINKKY